MEDACQWWVEWVQYQEVVRGCAVQCLAYSVHALYRYEQLVQTIRGVYGG